MALMFIANLILCYALVNIVVLTGWMSFPRGSLVGACAALALWPRRCLPSTLLRSSIQAVRHQCSLLADRHVFRWRHSCRLAVKQF